MHSDIYKGVTGPAEPVKATPLNRLENALSRLQKTADGTMGNAIALVGSWPSEAKENLREGITGCGVFGAVEDIATAIHRVCDKLDEANSVIAARLP